MREIKFRGKAAKRFQILTEHDAFLQSINSGQWVTIDSFLGAENTALNNSDADRFVKFFEHVAVGLIDPSTVGQWTGLKDSNGVEIWEGDKLKGVMREQGGAEKDWTNIEMIDFVRMERGVDCFGRSIANHNGRIYWRDGGHNMIPETFHEIINIEVCGNIHDKENNNDQS